MTTPMISVALLVLAALLGAWGQYFYQSGAEGAAGPLLSYLLNLRIAAGVLCYGAVMALFLSAFRTGGSLSVLYPIYGSTFMGAALISRKAYGTSISPTNVVGKLVLVVGMYLMGNL